MKKIIEEQMEKISGGMNGMSFFMGAATSFSLTLMVARVAKYFWSRKAQHMNNNDHVDTSQ